MSYQKNCLRYYYLKDIIKDTLDFGNNIYFCGCGATGRLSLTIETIWRQLHHDEAIENRIFSFMAGGDVALIRSIENFEDFPQFGARQLLEAGFNDGDLLIATTEGGETPFVIGAVEKASQISKRKPFFLYCNPDKLLCEVAERSKRVIENADIEKINLTVGPMAVTGSTRMQSSTILLAVAGIALLYYNSSNEDIENEINAFVKFWNSADINFIRKIYCQGN
jgi:N-acetylmuramic acid 6-phosphate etherase